MFSNYKQQKNEHRKTFGLKVLLYLYYMLLFIFIIHSNTIIMNVSNDNMKLSQKIIIFETKMKRMAGGTTIYV